MDTEDTGFVPLRTRPSLQTPSFQSPPQSPSRSPSRSPRIDSAARELDPLLANLSPASTLEALQANDVVSSSNNALAKSIAEARDTERAFGIRAALAAKKLKEWCAEAEEWYWPESKFEPPSSEEARSWLEKTSPTKSSYFFAGEGETSEFCGSMPESIVTQLEERIHDIKDDMDALDVEELKDHVRGSHLPSQDNAGSYHYLADFTMVITATILQALPSMARLAILLDVWSIRLQVLRQVPIFLNLLDGTDRAVTSAWNTLGKVVASNSSAGTGDVFDRSIFHETRDALGNHINRLGQNLDSILDILEGHQDRIPDRWIDEMEHVQEQYEEWVVAAENQVELNEWASQRKNIENGKAINTSDGEIAQDFLDADPLPKAIDEHNIEHSVVTVATDESKPNQQDKEAGSLTTDPQDRSNHDPLASNHEAHSLPLTPTSASDQEPDATVQQPDTLLGEARDISGSVSGSTSEEPVNKGIEAENHEPESEMGNCVSSTYSDKENDTDTESASSTRKDSEPQPTPSYFDTQDAQAFEHLRENSQFLSESNEPTPMQKSMLSSQHRPANLDLHQNETAENEQEAAPEPSSASTASFSDISEGQIMDAEPLQFYKSPVEEKFPPWNKNLVANSFSRRSSQRTETGSQTTVEAAKQGLGKEGAHARSRSASYASMMSDVGYDYLPSHNQHDGTSNWPELHGRNTSIASSDLSTHGQLKNTNIPRRTSSSVGSPVASPRPSITAPSEASPSSSPSLQVQKRRLPALNTLQTDQQSINTSRQWSGFSPLSPLDLENPEQLPPPPREDPPEHLSLSSLEEDFLSPEPVKKARDIDDQLREKITSMLTRIPAPIKFASGPTRHTPELKQRTSSLQPKSARSTRPSTPQLTLAPAETKTTKSRGDESSNIKLYHLHQPGKDAPIKLHVRLVGEGGERVMVRVGGGWADLEEYLKEYASHHSRRAVSEGQVHVTDLSTPKSTPPMPTQASFSNSSDRTSGRTTPSASRPSTPSFSGLSNFAMRKIRRASGLSNSPRTPDASSSKTLESTPDSAQSRRGSFRSASTQSHAEEETSLGLAGPKSRNSQISPRKQAWVEGMVNQVKQASAEKKRPELGDMGKVGSTRRLFTRKSTGGGGGGGAV